MIYVLAQSLILNHDVWLQPNSNWSVDKKKTPFIGKNIKARRSFENGILAPGFVKSYVTLSRI